MAKKHKYKFPRQPRQRKGESWKDFAARYNEWSDLMFPPERQAERHAAYLEDERLREESHRRYREVYRPAMIEEIKRKEIKGAVFFWFGAGVRDPYHNAGHWNAGTAGYITQPQLDFLLHQWYGTPLPEPRRPEDKCLQHEDHRCFHPVGNANWVSVRWYLSLLPGYLPAREWQPGFIRREHSKLFCCSEAAFLFARHVESAGNLQVRLVEGREKEGRSESVREFECRLYGIQPCWNRS